MNNVQAHSPTCARLLMMAERELAAFISAVLELYGPEHAGAAAEIWLDEMESMNNLPGPTSRDWRRVSVAVVARLASRMAVSFAMAPGARRVA